MKAKIKNVRGMKAVPSGDMGLFGDAAIATSKIETDFYVGDEKIGFVKFTRLTDATYVFELNVKGKKVGLSYTVPQEGTDDSEYGS